MHTQPLTVTQGRPSLSNDLYLCVLSQCADQSISLATKSSRIAGSFQLVLSAPSLMPVLADARAANSYPTPSDLVPKPHFPASKELQSMGQYGLCKGGAEILWEATPLLAATPQGTPLATATFTGWSLALLFPKSNIRPCSTTSSVAFSAPFRSSVQVRHPMIVQAASRMCQACAASFSRRKAQSRLWSSPQIRCGRCMCREPVREEDI